MKSKTAGLLQGMVLGIILSVAAALGAAAAGFGAFLIFRWALRFAAA